MADQDNTANKAPAVDDSPISPSRPDPARKNSLENHLLHRPERQELVESMFYLTAPWMPSA
jgi:hypothetical protein